MKGDEKLINPNIPINQILKKKKVRTLICAKINVIVAIMTQLVNNIETEYLAFCD